MEYIQRLGEHGEEIPVYVVDGVAHDLREGGTVELGPGDVLVQHGTDHRWRALTDDFRMASVMLERD